MSKGPRGPFFISAFLEKRSIGRKAKKKPDKCLALSFEGAFEANLQRGTLSLRKMGGGNAALR
ncbi:hypothetical protein CQ054_05660 [Ochrobactrum sp. MYb29]|nr:hypothetical protein CQ054_05660 [Ochrobactrum sp. MYb29]